VWHGGPGRVFQVCAVLPAVRWMAPLQRLPAGLITGRSTTGPAPSSGWVQTTCLPMTNQLMQLPSLAMPELHLHPHPHPHPHPRLHPYPYPYPSCVHYINARSQMLPHATRACPFSLTKRMPTPSCSTPSFLMASAPIGGCLARKCLPPLVAAQSCLGRACMRAGCVPMAARQQVLLTSG